MKPFTEEMRERAETQVKSAIAICEKYEYPTHDEPLALIVEDSVRFGMKAALESELVRGLYEAAQALSELADVPERHQDSEWYERKAGADTMLAAYDSALRGRGEG